MYRSKKLLTLPVISLSDGEELGKIKGLIIDPETISLTALVLDYRKGFLKEPRLIHFDQITSFGDYAVTVKNTHACERLTSRPQLNPLIRRPVQILGARVLREDGNLLGTVEEFIFDPLTGRISGLELTDNLISSLFRGRSFLDGKTILALGKNTIIVEKGAEASLIKEEAPIGDLTDSFKKTSKKVWGQTKETTKKIGSSLYRSVEKFTSEEDDKPTPPSKNSHYEAPPETDEIDSDEEKLAN